ncbi:MAG: response regulator transcription factor [Spirochaetales bacterium]|jgi:DNA-binding NarL/FixJ family response regulator|nr:response regulator transcription factor [Spirochaetales bacterium]
MKIILAEDQPLILSSLKILLSEEDEIEVVATASNGAEALVKISEHQPDIAVLDIYMPQMDGIETAKRAMQAFPHLPVVLLTTFDNPDSIRKAIEIGVAGFLLKDIEPTVFINALKAVAGGLIVYHPSIQPYLNTNLPIPGSLPPNNSYCLTKKDLTIISYIVQGMSNKEISFLENNSEGTIKNRVSSILSKMSLQARTQIAVTALKEGLV